MFKYLRLSSLSQSINKLSLVMYFLSNISDIDHIRDILLYIILLYITLNTTFLFL
jgi:hypothetical protein